MLDERRPRRLKQSVVARIRSALADARRSRQHRRWPCTGSRPCSGFSRISEILPMVEGDMKGRLLVFFPGVYEQNNYRLLDARDGWNYLAVPITASDAEVRPS